MDVAPISFREKSGGCRHRIPRGRGFPSCPWIAATAGRSQGGLRQQPPGHRAVLPVAMLEALAGSISRISCASSARFEVEIDIRQPRIFSAVAARRFCRSSSWRDSWPRFLFQVVTDPGQELAAAFFPEVGRRGMDQIRNPSEDSRRTGSLADADRVAEVFGGIRQALNPSITDIWALLKMPAACSSRPGDLVIDAAPGVPEPLVELGGLVLGGLFPAGGFVERITQALEGGQDAGLVLPDHLLEVITHGLGFLPQGQQFLDLVLGQVQAAKEVQRGDFLADVLKLREFTRPGQDGWGAEGPIPGV